MNTCFFIGKIITKIEYKFMINSKNKAIAYFEIELLDKNIVKVNAYNELADKCYKILEQENEIYIIGSLQTTGEINLQELYII